MDDLNGLNWSASSGSNASKQQPPSGANYYPTLRPTPPPSSSGRSTPLNAPTNPPKPAGDSFANLVSFGSAKSESNLSLQERQRLALQKKQKEEQEQKAKLSSQYGQSHDGSFWDSLESGNRSAKAGLQATNGDSSDIFSSFTPPQNATPPLPQRSPAAAPSLGVSGPPANTTQSSRALDSLEDDDPFELNKHQSKAAPTSNTTAEDDDVLGLLGKPVSEIPKAKPKREEPPPRRRSTQRGESPGEAASPGSKEVQELVDMGFPEGRARDALASTESGKNVQEAVGILLSRAHEEAKQKTKSKGGQRFDSNFEDEDSLQSRARSNNTGPSKAKPRSAATHETSGSSAEKDISKVASEVGNNLFKSANSLWNTGRKKVQKAVADFQQDGDPNQPKWMREAQLKANNESRDTSVKSSARQTEQNLTNEAAMLESAAPRRKSPMPTGNSSARSTPREQSPASAFGRESPKPAWMSQAADSKPKPRAPLRRGDADAEFTSVRPSPSWRSKPTRPVPDAKSDTLFDQPSKPIQSAASVPATNNSFGKPAVKPISKPSTPIVTRPKAPSRQIPAVSPSSLQASHSHRQAGTDHFKRGDYASAHASYTSAIGPLPQTHPLVIVLLTNRSLTALKTGSPKQAIDDANAALALIGPSQGEDEHILVANDRKAMRDYFAKALTRKAEALEATEKWAEAAAIWKEAVQAGVGGSIAIQGRDRCDRAAGKPKPAPSSTPQRNRPTPSTAPVRRPARPAAAATAQSTEAVNRLRAANKAADAADDEKFALADTVDAKLTAWKGGKADNLRALLGSLDTVLWPEAGWKKIGMAELVLPNKVKIHYMKGIAKVHPDKIPTTATTEQRMISAAVFSVLNEAWDKFKKENGL